MKIVAFLLTITLSITVCFGQGYDYPSVPDTLTAPQERIDYLAIHFWDNCDFSDVSIFRDSPKTILDFFYLLRLQSIAQQQLIIRKTIVQSCEYTDTYSWIFHWFEHFFHDCRSPYYDDELFLVFLTESLNAPIEDSMRGHAEDLSSLVQKNRIEAPAINFNFQTRNGRIHTLYEFDSPLTLLIFINPVCLACHAAQVDLSESSVLNQLLSQGNLQIIAINPGIEFDQWMASDYPVSWIVGYDCDNIINTDRLYDIQYYPALYLLDEEKRVILKQTRLDQIEERLRKQ